MSVVEMPPVVERTRWAAVIALGLAVFMAAIDLTVVATALPSIGTSFSATPGETQWVVLAYGTPTVALAIAAGRWLDGTNPRSAFLLGAIGFAASSVVAGLAPWFGLLIAARVVQGVFAAILSTIVFVVAARVVAPTHRGRAFGIIGTIGPLGSVLGPALGGLLISVADWRWIFYVNLPVCLVLVVLAWRALPSTGRLRLPGRAVLADALLTGVAVTALLLALSWRSSGSLLVITLVVVAIAAVTVWLALPQSSGVREALQSWKLSGNLVALLLTSLIGGSVYFLLPFALTGTLGLNSGVAGLTLLGMPLGIAIAAQFAGRLSDRIGPRIVAVLGIVVMTIGGASLIWISPSWGGIDVAWRLFLIGLGGGLFSAPNLTAIMAATPPQLLGTAGGLSVLFRTLGFAFGPAVASALWGGSPEAAAFAVPFTVLAVLPIIAIIPVLTASPARNRSRHRRGTTRAMPPRP